MFRPLPSAPHPQVPAEAPASSDPLPVRPAALERVSGRQMVLRLEGDLSLHDGLACGDVIDATRVVDADGAVLWEGPPLGVSGARAGTILAIDVLVDDPVRRRELYERTGADAVDLESGALARTGRLVGVLRAVSDTPERGLSGIAGAVDPEGRTDWSGLALAFARAPRGFARAAADARRALKRLEDVAA